MGEIPMAEPVPPLCFISGGHWDCLLFVCLGHSFTLGPGIVETFFQPLPAS